MQRHGPRLACARAIACLAARATVLATKPLHHTKAHLLHLLLAAACARNRPPLAPMAAAPSRRLAFIAIPSAGAGAAASLALLAPCLRVEWWVGGQEREGKGPDVLTSGPLPRCTHTLLTRISKYMFFYHSHTNLKTVVSINVLSHFYTFAQVHPRSRVCEEGQWRGLGWAAMRQHAVFLNRSPTLPHTLPHLVCLLAPPWPSGARTCSR